MSEGQIRSERRSSHIDMYNITKLLISLLLADREKTSCALSLPSTHLHFAWIGRALWLRTRIRAKAEWSAIVLS